MINDFNFNRKRKEPNEIKIDTSLIKDNFSYENLLTPNCNVEAVMGSIIEDYLSKTSNQEIIEIGGVDHALFRDLYEDPESEDPKIMFVKIIPKLSILKKMDIIEDINTWSVQYPQVIVEAIDNLYGKMDIENDSFPIKYLSIFDNGILKINGPGRKDYIQYRFDEETRRVEMITYQYDVDYKKFFATFTISLTYNFLNSSANDIKNSAIGSFFSLQDSTASKTSKYIHYVSSSDILKYGNSFDAMINEDDTILVSEYYYNMMKECTSVMMKPNRKNIPGNNKKIIDSRMDRLSNFSVRYTLMNDICYYIIAFLYYTMLVKYKIENKSKIEVEKKEINAKTVSGSSSKDTIKIIKRNIINLDSELKISTNSNDIMEQIKTKHFKYHCSFSVRGHKRSIKLKDGTVKEIDVKGYIKGNGPFKAKTYEMKGE